MTRRARQAGFTLIEIAVVLLIIPLAYGLVTPAFSTFVAGARLEGAARQLAMALREARSTAIVTGRALRFDIDPTTPGWRFGDRHGAFDRRLAVRLETAAGAPGGAGDTRGDTRGDTVDETGIAFFPDGHSTGGRVMLESAGQGRIIEIHWLTGRVSQSAY